MSDEADFIASNYPVPGFRFVVNIGGEVIRCSSVSGLDQQFETAEYRDGMGGLFRMTTRAQLPSIILSQAVFPGQCKLYGWLHNYSANTVEKKDIAISLTDESGKVLYVTWNVFNAFPIGISGPSLDESSNEFAAKQITFTADRISVVCH
ncbi:phage tail protein [Serratia rubidaea]|nr:phage tail protein [Serratia rubidaea]